MSMPDQQTDTTAVCLPKQTAFSVQELEKCLFLIDKHMQSLDNQNKRAASGDDSNLKADDVAVGNNGSEDNASLTFYDQAWHYVEKAVALLLVNTPHHHVEKHRLSNLQPRRLRREIYSNLVFRNKLINGDIRGAIQSVDDRFEEMRLTDRTRQGQHMFDEDNQNRKSVTNAELHPPTTQTNNTVPQTFHTHQVVFAYPQHQQPMYNVIQNVQYEQYPYFNPQ